MNLEILNNSISIDIMKLQIELHEFCININKDIDIKYNIETRRIVVTAKNLTDWTEKEHEQLCERFKCKLFSFTKKEVVSVLHDYRFSVIYEYSNRHFICTSQILEFPPKKY